MGERGNRKPNYRQRRRIQIADDRSLSLLTPPVSVVAMSSGWTDGRTDSSITFADKTPLPAVARPPARREERTDDARRQWVVETCLTRSKT